MSIVTMVVLALEPLGAGVLVAGRLMCNAQAKEAVNNNVQNLYEPVVNQDQHNEGPKPCQVGCKPMQPFHSPRSSMAR